MRIILASRCVAASGWAGRGGGVFFLHASESRLVPVAELTNPFEIKQGQADPLRAGDSLQGEKSLWPASGGSLTTEAGGGNMAKCTGIAEHLSKWRREISDIAACSGPRAPGRHRAAWKPSMQRNTCGLG